MDSGIPFLRVENLTDLGEIDMADVLAIGPATHRILGRSQLRVGDVLISIAGTIGRTAVIGAKHVPANCNQALALVRPISTLIMSEFLRAFLSSQVGQRSMLARSVQLAQANLSLGQIANTLVLVPSLDEQQRISETLGSIDHRWREDARALHKLRLLKRGLRDDLLTGRVRVTPLPDGDAT